LSVGRSRHMFSEIQDFGLILISLAALGFIVTDAFKTGLYWRVPDMYRNNPDKIFHYVSNAFLTIFALLSVLGLVFFNLNIYFSQDPFINIFNNFFKDLGFTNKTYIVASILSCFYILFYIFVFMLGVSSRYLNDIWINVFISNEEKPRVFKGFISETDDFFFFEKEEGILVEAIRKDKIERIESIYTTSSFRKEWNGLLNRLRKRSN
jgi:hypothetical protein